MASTAYHEPPDLLSEETRNLHRALVSLEEELEAIDFYGQRADACGDAQLKEVLHNRGEGGGARHHAAGVAAPPRWPLRGDDVKSILFTEAPITSLEPGRRRRAGGGPYRPWASAA